MKKLIRKLLREGLDKETLNNLKTQNRKTLPKIPINNVYPNTLPSLADIYKVTGKGNDSELNYKPMGGINVADVVPTQQFLNIDNLMDTQDVGADTGAELVKYGDKYYIIDGHHRIANAILQNINPISANVYDKNKGTN